MPEKYCELSEGTNLYLMKRKSMKQVGRYDGRQVYMLASCISIYFLWHRLKCKRLSLAVMMENSCITVGGNRSDANVQYFMFRSSESKGRSKHRLTVRNLFLAYTVVH